MHWLDALGIFHLENTCLILKRGLWWQGEELKAVNR